MTKITRKKIYKFLIISLITIILLPFLAYFIFRTSPVQSWASGKISAYASEFLGTKVDLQGLDLSLNSLILEGVYLEGEAQDTIAYVEKLNAFLESFDYSEKKVGLSKISLQQLKFNLKADSSQRLNLQFILDKFSSKEETNDSTNAAWSLECKKFELLESELAYQAYHVAETPDAINYNNLKISNLNLIFSELKMLGDSVALRLENLSFAEKSGLDIQHFETKILVSPQKIRLDDFHFQMPETDLKISRLQLKYKQYSDFSDFFTKVKMDIHIDSSHVNTADVAYFAPILRGANLAVGFSGKLKGSLSNLKLRKLKLNYGRYSKLLADADVKGLPELENSFIWLKIKELSTHKIDLETIPMIPFGEGKTLSLPENIAGLGLMKYAGSFTGFLNDFVADGTFTSKLGKLTADLKFFPDKERAKALAFKGKVATINFDAGKIVAQPDLLGKLTLEAQIDGYHTDKEGVNAKIDAVVKLLELKHYQYHDISLNGQFANNAFDGKVAVDDKNLKFNFAGKADFSDKTLPVFNFIASIKNTYLGKLKLTADSLSKLNIAIKANFKGVNPENLLGNLKVENLYYGTSKKNLQLDKLLIDSKLTDNEHVITVSSEILDINAAGKFHFLALSDSIQSLLAVYLPKLFSPPKVKLKNGQGSLNDFNFKITLKDILKISKYFLPELTLSNNATFSGHYKPDNSFSATCLLNSFDYNDVGGELLKIKLDGTRQKLNLNFSSDEFFYGKSLYLSDIQINTSTEKDSTRLRFSWDNGLDSANYRGDVVVDAVLATSKIQKKIPAVRLNFQPSEFAIQDSIWRLQKANFLIDGKFFNIKEFKFEHNKHTLSAYGKVSDNPADSLFVRVSDFDLSYINTFTPANSLKINGILNGQVALSNLFENVFFYVDSKIDKLRLNKRLFGDVKLKSFWQPDSQLVKLNLEAKRGRIKTIQIDGDYAPKSKAINFDAALKKVDLRILRTFLGSFLSDIVGRASGNIKITGTTEKPDIQGIMSLQKMAFVVNYLQTRYNFTEDSVIITNNSIAFDKAIIYDMNGERAITTGKITHNVFKNIKFNIDIDAKRFQFLNTTAEESDMYYGTAYATGLIDISGSPDDMVINVSAKTEPNTFFYIPLSSDASVQENNFIQFINTGLGTTEQKVETYTAQLSGIKMDFSLDVTPDAELQIIMDEKVGDIIKARGDGNIRLVINTLGDFNMYGDLNITKGDYLFTLQNLVNKKFDVRSGGSLHWMGDPFNAELNLEAYYHLKKVPLYDLVLDDEFKDTQIPIDCSLQMSGSLMNPNIEFGIDFLDAADDIAIELSADNLNKQFLSLLIINRFQPLPGLESGSSLLSTRDVKANASELLSNQLSHWLSQISNDFDIGVNYRPGDEISNDELAVALSTQLFNDRVSVNVNGNLGMGDNSQNKNASNIAGDFDIDYKITKNGKFRIKYYARSNDNQIYDDSKYKQGIGVYYRENFDTFKELLKRYLGTKTK